MITTPYPHPKAYCDERERAIHELLALGNIKPSSNPFCFISCFGEEEGWVPIDVH